MEEAKELGSKVAEPKTEKGDRGRLEEEDQVHSEPRRIHDGELLEGERITAAGPENMEEEGTGKSVASCEGCKECRKGWGAGEPIGNDTRNTAR